MNQSPVVIREAINDAVRWCFVCKTLHYLPAYLGAENLAWMREHCPNDVPRAGCNPWFGPGDDEGEEEDECSTR